MPMVKPRILMVL